MKNIITVLIIMLPFSGFSFIMTGHWNAKDKSMNREIMLHITNNGLITIRYIELDPNYSQCIPDVNTIVWMYKLYPQSNDLANILLVDSKTDKKAELKVKVIKRKHTEIDSFSMSGQIQHILPYINNEQIQFRRVSQIMPDQTIRYMYFTQSGGVVDQLLSADEMSYSNICTNLRLKNRIVNLDSYIVRKLVEQIHLATNLFRNEKGSISLVYESTLDSAAQKQVVYLANDWIKKGTRYLSHTQDTESEFFNGENVSDRIGINNKLSMGSGENLLYTTNIPDNITEVDSKKIKPEVIKELAGQIVRQWVNSKAHRENMLYNEYKSFGCKIILVAYQYDDYYINVKGEKITFNEYSSNKESYVLIAAQVFSTFKN